jgi:hypothetical protein
METEVYVIKSGSVSTTRYYPEEAKEGAVYMESWRINLSGHPCPTWALDQAQALFWRSAPDVWKHDKGKNQMTLAPVSECASARNPGIYRCAGRRPGHVNTIQRNPE